MCARRARIYAKVAAVIGAMPERFAATELYEAAGLTAKHPASRMLVASVLTNDFGLINVGTGGNRRWKKTSESAVAQ